jgi:WbqC-like protein
MRRKRAAIVQSSYIPWKGYFDLIRSVDAFILLDNVQFTRRDWRSRNRIKTRHGLAWLSIPVHTRGRYTQLIQDTTTSDPHWGRRHWQTIQANYAKAPYFDRYADRLAVLYEHPSTHLSEINHAFITPICDVLGITTPITWSSEYATRHAPSERLIDLCLAVGATEYLSGPSAANYLDIAAFEAAGVAVQFADYSGYAEYLQLHGPFEHSVSVLDLLFCTGPRALDFMKKL